MLNVRRPSGCRGQRASVLGAEKERVAGVGGVGGMLQGHGSGKAPQGQGGPSTTWSRGLLGLRLEDRGHFTVQCGDDRYSRIGANLFSLHLQVQNAPAQGYHQELET